MTDLKFYKCDNCSFEFIEDTKFCPQCGIIIVNLNEDNFFICPICNAKNNIGERKCKYCCSLF